MGQWKSFLEELIKETKIKDIFASSPFFIIKLVQFADTTHKDIKFRHWITFRTDDDQYCILSCFTSSDRKVMFYRNMNNDNALDSIVHITPEEFNPPFNKLTYLDCNIQDMKNKKSHSDLKKIIDWKQDVKIPKYTLPQNIEDKIIKAIVNSNFTSPIIKNGFRKTYPHLFVDLNKEQENKQSKIIK